MVTKRGVVRLVLVLAVVVTSTVVGSTTAMAAELGDYLWSQRPLLVFAPVDDDARLAETRRRVEATKCDFVDRDMVLGVVVTEGTSTLDGQPIGTAESARLAQTYGVGADDYTALLIGKDGGEKLRVDGVPDLQSVYDLIDGMPMRGNEMSADGSRC